MPWLLLTFVWVWLSALVVLVVKPLKPNVVCVVSGAVSTVTRPRASYVKVVHCGVCPTKKGRDVRLTVPLLVNSVVWAMTVMPSNPTVSVRTFRPRMSKYSDFGAPFGVMPFDASGSLLTTKAARDGQEAEPP